MAHVLHSNQIYRRARDGITATFRAVARIWAAEHTLALRAAAKADSPRRSLAEVRAMYVSTGEAQQEPDSVAQTTKSTR